jgi:hypothetical protein
VDEIASYHLQFSLGKGFGRDVTVSLREQSLAHFGRTRSVGGPPAVVFAGGILIKRFRVPAWSQELILEALDEEGWPPHLDDPLPQSHDVEPQHRLRYAIKGLNRNQRKKLLRFAGDGRGREIVWWLLGSAIPADPDCARIAP